MTEKGATFTFAPGCTSVVFPTPQPSLPDFSFTATLMHRLSFLHCEFMPPPSRPPSPVSNLSVDIDSDTALVALFPTVQLPPNLWHRRFRHLGCNAMCAALTKEYATGITYDGNFDTSHCIPCLIGKQPQHLFTHHGHRASAIGELLHVDVCGPFLILTLQKHSSFIAILDDYSNFGYVGLL